MGGVHPPPCPGDFGIFSHTKTERIYFKMFTKPQNLERDKILKGDTLTSIKTHVTLHKENPTLYLLFFLGWEAFLTV